MARTYKTVSHLGAIITGKTPKTSVPEYWCGKIPFITPTDINSFSTYYQYKTERTISEIGASLQEGTILPPNCVCFSCIATIGKACITKIRSITNQQINSIIPNKENDYRYILYLLRYNLPYVQMIAGGSGSGTPIINKGKFARLKFLIEEDLLIQNHIASILSTYDTLIENNMKRIRLLEKMAENLYKEWFVRFRFPGHENVEMVDGLPKGWRQGKLGDIAKFLNGFAFQSKSFCTNGDYAIVTIKNVQANGFDGNNTDKIKEIPTNMPEHCKLHDGDILLSLTGNIGRVCRVLGTGYLLNQRVAKLLSKNPFFCYCTFRSDYIFQSLNIISYGTAQLNLSPVKASKIKMQVPTGHLIELFEEKVTPLFAEANNLQHQNALLARQRDLLLPRLMSGRLEVKC